MDAADLILEVGEVAAGQKDGLVRKQGPYSVYAGGRWQVAGRGSTLHRQWWEQEEGGRLPCGV